jgi:hypothetical protein
MKMNPDIEYGTRAEETEPKSTLLYEESPNSPYSK